MERIPVQLTSLMFIFFLSVLFPLKAHALWCTNGSQTVQYNGAGGTIKVSIDPLTLNKQALDVLLTDMNQYATCNGSPKSGYEDAVRVNALTLSSALTNLGFSGYLINSNNTKIKPVVNACIWPDAACSVLNWSQDTSAKLIVKLGLEREVGSGTWKTGATIPAGTEIARLETQYRYGGGAKVNVGWKTIFYWSFVLKSAMVIPAYTCTITQYDKTVTLPNVDATVLRGKSAGRYADAKKEFSIALGCGIDTNVTVTFDGSPMAGTDNVLKNSLADNDNVGIQMTFSDDTPIKLATQYPIVSSSQTTELLKFNAYYYYKGGRVKIGPVKAITTFTFEYE